MIEATQRKKDSMKYKVILISLFISATGFANTVNYDVEDSASQRQIDRLETKKMRTLSKNKFLNRDEQTSREVRNAIRSDKTLSQAAQDLNVMTTNGKVTITGELKSSDEIVAVVKKAGKVAGASKVSNQINLIEK